MEARIPERIGKYEIRGVLGQGGMGMVYDAWEPVIQRRVALKVVEKSRVVPEDRELLLARFRHEAQAAARLNHPNIVAIYEYGEEGDCAFIAMECVVGKSLSRMLDEGYRGDPGRLPDILDQMLMALAYSHGRGVIHRDVKASNLLVAEDGRAKLTDFGIARLESSNLTVMGDVLGTPAYMPPEQFEGSQVDERSDVYAAAVIVYEVLTGRRPFVGTNAQVMKQVLSDPPPDASFINPRLPVELDAVLAKALAKKPDDRYASALQFRDAVVAALGHRPRAPASSELDTTITVGRAKNGAGGVDLARMRRIGQSVASQGAPAPAATKPTDDTVTRTASAPATRAPGRILFVDDEERILSALAALFRGRFETVMTASSGEEALKLMAGQRFDLLVSDQRMPGMKGVDLLREARSRHPNMVRILLTGYSDLAAIVGSINDGEVFRFVSKPWNNKELVQVVGEAVAIGRDLADAPPPATEEAPPALDGPGVLVVDDGEEVAKAVGEVMADVAPVWYARSLDEALKTMAGQEVAVVVADIETGAQDNTAFFKLLKQEHPEVLTLVVTAASDSEVVIDLINRAQIFRFLNKPVVPRILRQHLAAARRAWRNFERQPELLRQHQVAAAPEARESSLGSVIMEGLKSLRSRIARVLR